MATETSIVRSAILEDALAAQGLTGARRGPARPDALARILADIPLFESVNGRTLRRLAGRTTVRRVRGGDPIVREGFSGEALYVLLTGRARVERDGAVIAVVERGGFFGEIALLDGRPRSATVIADCDLWVMRLPREGFIDVVRSEPDVAMTLLAELAGRLRRAGR